MTAHCTCHSEGRKPHPLAYSAYTPRTLKDSSPSLKMRADKISHPITFWQRFFFLWLRFFPFGRSKKKEMNKTALYTTGYFAYAQYDTLSF